MSVSLPKSMTYKEKHKRLIEVIKPTDTLGILIDADPDSMASALALKRLLWRQVKHVFLSKITLRTTGVSPWVKAFQPEAGNC